MRSSACQAITTQGTTMMLCDDRPMRLSPGARGFAASAMVTMLLFGVLPRNAHADPTDDIGDSLSVLGGYGWPSRALHTAGRAATYSAIYGHPLPLNFSIEGNLNGSIFETGVPGGTDYYQY